MARATRKSRRTRARLIRWSCCALLLGGIGLGWEKLPRPALSLIAFAAGACAVSSWRAEAVRKAIRVPARSDKPHTPAMPWAAAKVWRDVDAHRDLLDLLRQRTHARHRGMGRDGGER